MRGLKQCTYGIYKNRWWSHLLQMRGLKLKDEYDFEIKRLSHLLQMRGLKPTTSTDNPNLVGRIFYRCVD